MKDSRAVTNGYKGHTCSILSTGVLESRQGTDTTYTSVQNNERLEEDLRSYTAMQ